MLACIWGGERYAWASPQILGADRPDADRWPPRSSLRERRAADPIVPLDLLRTHTVAVAAPRCF